MTKVPLSIAKAATALRSGRLSAVELDQRRGAAGGPPRRRDRRVPEPLRRDRPRRRGRGRSELGAGDDRGPLHGIPLGIKDIIATSEGPTTAQSLVVDPSWFAGRDAVTVARLRAAGAIIVGKTTLMEHAVGWPDPDKPFPIPRNPWDLRRWAGGSSSGQGSGAAIGCSSAASAPTPVAASASPPRCAGSPV